MSYFDPFSINKRSTHKSHVGQVIRQRPITSNRSYSPQDLEKAKKILDAYRIPYGENPPEPPVPVPTGFPTVIYNGILTTDYMEITNQLSAVFNTAHIWAEFTQTEDFGVIETAAQTFPASTPLKIFISVDFPTLTYKTTLEQLPSNTFAFELNMPQQDVDGLITTPMSYRGRNMELPMFITPNADEGYGWICFPYNANEDFKRGNFDLEYPTAELWLNEEYVELGDLVDPEYELNNTMMAINLQYDISPIQCYVKYTSTYTIGVYPILE